MVPLMTQPPSSSFSHISPLGGAIALINPSSCLNKNSNSLAFRIAWYIIKLFRSSCPIFLPPQDQVIIIKNLALIHQSATHSSSAPWFNSFTNIFAEIDHILTICEQKEFEAQSLVMSTVRQQLFEDSRGVSSASYYSACAFLFLESEYNQKSRKAGLGPKAEPTEASRESSDIFQQLVTLNVATDKILLVKKLNEILSDLIGFEFEKQLDTGMCCRSYGEKLLTNIALRQLVTLNCIICSKELELIAKVPKQRVVLFVKHGVNQVYKGKSSKEVINEVLKLLSALIVPIKDIYDSFWQQMIDFIDETLSLPNEILDDENIPLLHATLELFTSLKTLKTQESNEDLEDAWREKEESLLNRLLNLLKECQGVCPSANSLHYCCSFISYRGVR